MMTPQSPTPPATPATPPTTVQHYALPAWFITFQDTAGLSLLIIALMGINGVVYASGVVPNIEDPSSWGLFRTVLFALFFAAGAAMPGVALRAGAGIFLGRWYRRLACLLVSLLFFALEVWCSITERSLNTLFSPADRWLLAVIGQPNLPFSPTVLVISFALSLTVIVWGLVTGARAEETAEDRAARQAAEESKALHDARMRAIRVGGVRQMALVGLGKVNPLGPQDGAQSGSGLNGEDANDTTPNPDGGDGPAGAGLGVQSRRGSGGNLRTLRLAPSRPDALKGRITAQQLVEWVAQNLRREISERDALMLLHSLPDSGRTRGVTGRAVSAPKAVALQRARAKWGTAPTERAAGA